VPPQQRRFKQVDVFTAEAFERQSLAVVLDSAGLDTAALPRFTDWTNCPKGHVPGSPKSAKP